MNLKQVIFYDIFDMSYQSHACNLHIVIQGLISLSGWVGWGKGTHALDQSTGCGMTSKGTFKRSNQTTLIS